MRITSLKSGGKYSTGSRAQKRYDTKRNKSARLRAMVSHYEERTQVPVTLPRLEFMRKIND